MGPTFTRDVWRGIVLADYFTDARIGVRLLAQDADHGLRIWQRCWNRVRQALGVSPRALDEAVALAAKDLRAIPRWRSLADLKKVLIVGEIYVRRDDFSVEEVCDFLIQKGIYPKVTGVSEWFHYTDYARHFLMKDRRKRDGLLRWLREGGLREEAGFYVEELWKGSVESKIHNHLASTGLCPEVPNDLAKIIGERRSTFVEPDLESEATVSPAVGAAAMQEGYSGVAIIAPFGCLIGRLIEGVYAPWAKARGYPVIALENDGQPYPPNIISRLEIFAHNVLRFAPGREDLLSPDPSDPMAVTWSGAGKGRFDEMEASIPDSCAACSLDPGETSRRRID
jgi:hypothetical protein